MNSFFFFWFQVLSSSAGDHSQLDRASPQRVGRILQESNNPVIAVKTDKFDPEYGIK